MRRSRVERRKKFDSVDYVLVREKRFRPRRVRNAVNDRARDRSRRVARNVAGVPNVRRHLIDRQFLDGAALDGLRSALAVMERFAPAAVREPNV
jgi:hypothetical protein